MSTPDAEPHAPPPEFAALCAQVGIELEPEDVGRLAGFIALLVDANTRTNLTGVRDPAELWTRHVFDALTLMSVLESVDGPLDVLDIGSGGGLPALPLAIVRPTDRFTMLEATGKKCDFLEHAIASLGLSNASVLRGRAERLGHQITEPALRGRFDVVTSRAVGRVAVAAELCVPFAKDGGLVVLVKGAQAQEELAEAKKALHMLHAAPAGIVETPTGRLVVLEKLRATPKMYPRLDGEPKRAPLGVTGPAAGKPA